MLEKPTYTPTASLLLNAAYRYSKRSDTSGDAFGTRNAGTTGTGGKQKLQIGTLELSNIINNRAFFTAKTLEMRQRLKDGLEVTPSDFNPLNWSKK